MPLKPEAVTAIVDTREQAPFDLSPMGAERGTLATGDYSVRGLEDLVCLERKALNDLTGCITHDRERFENRFPVLELVEQKWIRNYPRYLLSGGLNFRQLLPTFSIPLLKAMEVLLLPLGRLTALHHYVVLRKRAMGEVRD